MDNELRLATKAQAQAVREYLAGIGHDISHTQALEVLARGRGLRSRQVLAAQIDAADTPAQAQRSQVTRTTQAAPEGVDRPPYTRVYYTYADGANCKRLSQIVFRGRLIPEQLRLIASRLDEGMFFLPAQVGFENLQLAFTDCGADDHGWHRIELAEESEWKLDEEGYVLWAGDIEQVSDAVASKYATDADCENLVWRFARVLEWNHSGQTDLLVRGMWNTPDAPEYDAQRVAQVFACTPALSSCPQSLLHAVAQTLLFEGFALSLHAGTQEMRCELGSNAYQFCKLEAPEDASHGALWLNFDVTTLAGTYLTHAPRICVDPANPAEALAEFTRAVAEQRQAVRVMPEVWSKDFE
jgi:hypothetical protein